MLFFKDIRREEAEDCLAGAIDNDALLEESGCGLFGELLGLEFDAEHEANAAHVGDGRVLLGEGRGVGAEEVGADFGYVFKQVRVADLVDDGDGHRGGEWIAAESRAVHAGGDGCRGGFGAEHGADGQAAGEGLGDGGDVGLNAEVLVGEPLARASEAALNLIGDEQGTGLVT